MFSLGKHPRLMDCLTIEKAPEIIACAGCTPQISKAAAEASHTASEIRFASSNVHRGSRYMAVQLV